MRHLILIPAFLALASAAQASPSIPAGKALAEETCAACHGEKGNAPEDPSYPKLSGQKPAYIAQQLRAFRAGTRKSEVMENFAKPLSDAQIADLAAWFASLSRAPEPAGMKVPGNPARGARLWQARGNGAPPCARCHAPADFQRPGGGNGRGGGMRGGMGQMAGHGPLGTDPATTPVLYAQHADYLRGQLDAFSSGERKDPVMEPIAGTLSAADRADLAAYLASVK